MDPSFLLITDPAIIVSYAAGAASYPVVKKVLQFLLILVVVKKIFDGLVFIAKTIMWFFSSLRRVISILRRNKAKPISSNLSSDITQL